MDDIEGVYQHKKDLKYYVIKIRDLSMNRYMVYDLNAFINGAKYGTPYGLLHLSEGFIRTEGCRKLDVLHNIKERIYESNRIR
jgi:hypothetical protein